MEATDQTLARRPVSANSDEALRHRREVRTLTWRGPALMLLARPVLAVGAQAVVAAVFAVRGSSTPWHDAEPWLPVYGTLIDIGCLALLWHLTRREGIGLFDLVGFRRARLIRDASLGLALIPISLVFIFGGTYLAGWLVYLLVRFRVLFPSTSLAIAVVAFVWSLQHAFMPLTFDAKFMAYRLLAAPLLAVFDTLVYLRLRRLVPLAVAHALMDGATVLIPLLRLQL